MDWCHTGRVWWVPLLLEMSSTARASIMNHFKHHDDPSDRTKPESGSCPNTLAKFKDAPAEYGRTLSDLLRRTSCYQPRSISEICCKQLGVDVNSPKALLVARAWTAMRSKFWWRFAQDLRQMIPRMSGGGGLGSNFGKAQRCRCLWQFEAWGVYHGGWQCRVQGGRQKPREWWRGH